MNAPSTTSRQHILDALRGFAIIAIMLLHNLEHFDYYFKPESLPEWIQYLDTKIWDLMFFLFAGKAYAIFALLFGVTFFIQMNNQTQKGIDFRPRFAWRLVLLMLFGLINTVFFQGDILLVYAFVGFLLIPFYKVNSKTIVIIGSILLLQPLELYYFYENIRHPGLGFIEPKSWAYFGNMKDYIEGSSFIETAKGNLLNGRLATLYWYLENRIFHILGFFLFGFLAGRKMLFLKNDINRRFWKRALYVSVTLFIPLYFIHLNANEFITELAANSSFKMIIASWRNVMFTVFILSVFYLVFYSKSYGKILSIFSPIGKMSLSNYVFQSMVGSFIYYGYGLGWYKYTGATYSLLVAVTLSILTWFLCKWWLKSHKRGPLEILWHKLTWLQFRKENSK